VRNLPEAEQIQKCSKENTKAWRGKKGGTRRWSRSSIPGPKDQQEERSRRAGEKNFPSEPPRKKGVNGRGGFKGRNGGKGDEAVGTTGPRVWKRETKKSRRKEKKKPGEGKRERARPRRKDCPLKGRRGKSRRTEVKPPWRRTQRGSAKRSGGGR